MLSVRHNLFIGTALLPTVMYDHRCYYNSDHHTHACRTSLTSPEATTPAIEMSLLPTTAVCLAQCMDVLMIGLTATTVWCTRSSHFRLPSLWKHSDAGSDTTTREPEVTVHHCLYGIFMIGPEFRRLACCLLQMFHRLADMQ